MTTYERVRYDDGERSRTIYLRDPRVVPFLGAEALTGIEVDRETNEIAPRGADELRRVIALDCITKRTPVYVSKTYGTLE